MKKEKKGEMKMARKMYYRYYGSSPREEFGHPTIEVFIPWSGDPTAAMVGHEVISFVGQTDRERGHELLKSYAWKADISMEFGSPETASKLLADLIRFANREGRCYNVRTIVAWLRKKKATRMIRNPELGEWVPAQFRNHARQWWEAAKSGFELHRRCRC